jgi:ribonuclease BN (tRNA processing enzyme)
MNDPNQVLLGEDSNQKLINFITHVDVLVHDAQYTEDEYQKKVTWGHSPVEYTVGIALKAEVKKLVLFHHDPMHDDNTIDEMLEHARKFAKSSGGNIEILAASEGLLIEI